MRPGMMERRSVGGYGGERKILLGRLGRPHSSPAREYANTRVDRDLAAKETVVRALPGGGRRRCRVVGTMCALDGEGRAELRPHRLANRAVGYTHAPITFAYFLGG